MSPIHRLADEGKAVVVISPYLPESLAVSDRILVARLGRIVAEFDAATATEDRIIYAAIHRWRPMGQGDCMSISAVGAVPPSNERGQGETGGKPGEAGHHADDAHPKIIFVQGQTACHGMTGENRNQLGH
jgi:ABC-type multidrug transport system ATPase subunit